MSTFVEVKVADLIGPALDWAISCCLGEHDIHDLYGVNMVGEVEPGVNFSPSTDWNIGGPLIKKYGVMLSPPTSLVHRNFGNWDSRNGYYESGYWGATIFAKERKHRRKAFEHPDQPLVVVMRAIVQFELGDVVSVPAELMP